MFLMKILLENNPPLEQHKAFICSGISRCYVKFSTGASDHMNHRSHFLKSFIVFSLVWLSHCHRNL
jgi:hypothetical protein